MSQLSDLCARVSADVPDMAEVITSQIRASFPEYQSVDRDDHASHVREQNQRQIDTIAERRDPNAADLARVGTLGRLRAWQGLPVETVMGAWHIGSKELLCRFIANGDGHEELLPEVAVSVLSTINILTTELASAHATVDRAKHALKSTIRRRFLDLLLKDDASPEELTDIALSLGFQPDGHFIAAYIQVGGDDRDGVLHAQTDSQPISELTVMDDGLLATIRQSDSPQAFSQLARIFPAPARIAIGAPRAGLRGASLSLADAADCLRLTSPANRISQFSNDWLDASLISQHDRLADISPLALQVAKDHPALAETILTFARLRHSIVNTAETMHLHKNTVLYRLNRWQSLSELDPRSVESYSIALLSKVGVTR